MAAHTLQVMIVVSVIRRFDKPPTAESCFVSMRIDTGMVCVLS